MRVAGLMATKPVADVLDEATGRRLRTDPVLADTGGPAGNAVLTAWTGLALLVLGVAELLTLFDVRGLISWHVAIGALLVPPALVKTGSTGWRIVRYYFGNPAYRTAGPPSTVMRLLGPLVVVSTLALLGSGIVLVVLGEQSSRQAILTALGFRIDWITVHQAAFVVWAAATGLHLLGRIVPALRLTFGADHRGRLPGAARRVAVIPLVAVAAGVLAVVLVSAEGSWGHDDFGPGDHGPEQLGLR
jgi:hypothetical protein